MDVQSCWLGRDRLRWSSRLGSRLGRGSWSGGFWLSRLGWSCWLSSRLCGSSDRWLRNWHWLGWLSRLCDILSDILGKFSRLSRCSWLNRSCWLFCRLFSGLSGCRSSWLSRNSRGGLWHLNLRSFLNHMIILNSLRNCRVWFRSRSFISIELSWTNCV